MINTSRPDRLWIIGGVLGAVILLATGWFFVVGPQYAEANDLRIQAEGSEDRISLLQQRLVELRKQNEDLPLYQAQLANARAALPTTPALSDLLREMQAGGDSAGVVVSGLTIGAAAPVTTAGSGVSALPITLTATGTVAKLEQFLIQLQQVQPRALLISNVNLDSGATGAATLSITLQAFVAAD